MSGEKRSGNCAVSLLELTIRNSLAPHGSGSIPASLKFFGWLLTLTRELKTNMI